MNTSEALQQAVISSFDQVTNTSFLGKTDKNAYIYRGFASDKWCIGDVPHVRYVMGIMIDSVLQHFSNKYQTDPVALNCFFFSKTIPGDLILEIHELKMSNKGYCVGRCTLKQRKDLKPLVELINYNPSDWIDKVQCIFTMGNMDNEQGPTFYHKNPTPPPTMNHLQPYSYLFMGEYLTAYFDMSSFPINDTEPGVPEVTQTMAFSDGRPIDFKSIPYWCDMFITPPSLLGPAILKEPVWCPTMQLEIQFKRKPSGKQIMAHFITPHIINGRFDLDGEIWNEKGEILAITRHQCLVVPWSRNSKDDFKTKQRIGITTHKPKM
ncbi:thioesterase-like superfamily-domain-containing protein [Cokeromyces recurvatus]|uniref:thioesterase-like superfamily-domain-containing protein n=1 Tax=Cokeromyces recurvatus TaxID=90255 RepID=UPI00221E80B5|nr:thioesterase-like superfamily-domain-containing protein [Cokeromyces recurvatus]KAI7901728.1 thioesterase-like superfamily-domain-containing protein [Cokeromyces recurvatus]